MEEGVTFANSIADKPFTHLRVSTRPVIGAENAQQIFDGKIYLLMCSSVATWWHGWTMSRGPGAKGAPRERQKIFKKRK